jgi:hypothetical protein
VAAFNRFAWPQSSESAARVLNADKVGQSWLKKSLGTKDLHRANILAKPVLAEFDRIIAKAEALVADRPLRNYAGCSGNHEQGHANNTVHGRYGAKVMVFGR